MEYLISLFLVAFSALFSGLTLGFFSLSKDDLQRKADLGDVKATQIYGVRQNGNLLLCTLLVGNVAVNSALSIFLGTIASGLMAGFIATALIVIFGEIIPQSVFSRYALEIGADLVPLVKFFIFILFPICFPMAFLLDKILGQEIPNVYSRHEILKIIEEHEDNEDSDIDNDEERIIKGALSYSDKTVAEVMTPAIEMFSLTADEKLDKKTMNKIYEAGHSRIPVFDEENEEVVGMLYTKDLINTDYQDKMTKEVSRKDVIFVDYNKPLDDLLNAFKQTRHHLFIVLGEYGQIRGLVTIEDVLEEIIGAEIVDEFDKYEDLRLVAKKRLEGKKIKKV